MITNGSSRNANCVKDRNYVIWSSFPVDVYKLVNFFSKSFETRVRPIRSGRAFELFSKHNRKSKDVQYVLAFSVTLMLFANLIGGK